MVGANLEAAAQPPLTGGARRVQETACWRCKGTGPEMPQLPRIRVFEVVSVPVRVQYAFLAPHSEGVHEAILLGGKIQHSYFSLSLGLPTCKMGILVPAPLTL